MCTFIHITKYMMCVLLACSLAANPLLSVASIGAADPGGRRGAELVGGALEPFLTTCTSFVLSEATMVEGFNGGWEESGGRAMIN